MDWGTGRSGDSALMPEDEHVAVPDDAAKVQRLETIFRLAPLGIGVVDLAGHTVMSNETLRRLLGYTADEFATIPWSRFTHPDDVARNVELFEQMEAGEIDHFTMQKRFICKDGRILWTELTSSMVYDAHGAPDYVIGMVQDIDERKRLERELSTAEQHYRLLVERVPAVVYTAEAGPHGRWGYVSPQIEGMLGYTAAEWMADPTLWLNRLHPEDRDRTVAVEEQLLVSELIGEPRTGSYRMVHRAGHVVWVRDDAIALTEHDGRVSWHGVLVDVTHEKHLEERLGHQAYHDPLTGLPNRVLFHDRVGEMLSRSRGSSSVWVMFIDLDRFKTINDSFGHAAGDEVIVAAARRIKRCVRGSDVAARLGGDEFALLVTDSTPEQVSALADRILDALRGTPMRLGALTVTVGASIGIAGAGPDDTVDTLLRNADLAMYRAKRQGRSRYFHYHGGLHDEVVSRFRIEESLQAAVADDQITLVYQPIVDLDTGEVVALEALARWRDPELGVVPPSQFIPVAEQTGVIRELGATLIGHACTALREWRVATGGTACMSVNVSPLQLDDRFPGVVREAVAACGLDPSAVILEVTEGLLLVEGHRDSIRELRELGVRVAIDDFGTGYSSLSYLRELPVDLIKIDQVFLRPGPGGVDDDGMLLEAIIGLTEGLHLQAICEGVENIAQLQAVRTAGVRYGQGFLLAAPGPVSDIPARLDLPGTAVTTRFS